MIEPTFHEAFEKLEAAELTANDVRDVFDAILGGKWTSAQIAALLVALRMKGESPEIVAAAARSMRAAMVPVPHSFDALLDTCGTGGDASGSVNLSTGAAIIAAAAGARVAKHGNRAASSKCGSADVLEQLGVVTSLPASAAGRVLREASITFMIAPTHHPAMRFAAPVRKELKVRTLFNCLGPLANPAGATHQLVGAYADELRPIMAETLRQLGSVRAWVVRGADGMDEVSPYGPTHVTQLSEGKLEELVVQPGDFGLPVSPPGAASGGDATLNAEILTAVLSDEPHPARDAVVLNAAAALVVADSMNPRDAAARVAKTIASGAALETLKKWVRTTQEAASAT